MAAASSSSNMEAASSNSEIDDVLETMGYDQEYIARQINPEIQSFQYCDECNIPMNQIPSGLECSNCHRVKDVIGGIKDCSTTTSGVLKTSFGGGKRSIYTSVPDNTKSQRKQILDQLTRLNAEYEGHPKFPLPILTAAAEQYNVIQQVVIDVFDKEGSVCGSKKIVKRSSIKDEVLGALIYYQCIIQKSSRKCRDVAIFMQLQSTGISRGNTMVRQLHNSGKINIPIHAEPSNDFVRRYLQSLGLFKLDEHENPTDRSLRYEGFVNDLVALSVKLSVSWSSVQSSKIVGAIWVLIIHEKLDISHNKVTECCDSIKKNTFTKFSSQIDANLIKFVDVFNKYKIYHGIRGRVRKVLKK